MEFRHVDQDRICRSRACLDRQRRLHHHGRGSPRARLERRRGPRRRRHRRRRDRRQQSQPLLRRLSPLRLGSPVRRLRQLHRPGSHLLLIDQVRSVALSSLRSKTLWIMDPASDTAASSTPCRTLFRHPERFQLGRNAYIAPQRSMNISTAARPITATVIQPSITIVRLAVKAPITDLLEAINTITTSNGTATIPLITALQNSAFMGLIGEYWINNPARTLTAITA